MLATTMLWRIWRNNVSRETMILLHVRSKITDMQCVLV